VSGLIAFIIGRNVVSVIHMFTMVVIETSKIK